MTVLDALLKEFSPLAGKMLLDIGCGEGRLARALFDAGAKVTGVDPSERALAEARIAAPESLFEAAPAERLPFPDGRFDGAILLNSLHHVEGERMDAALAEADRVTAERGRIVVVEPEASGSFFDAFLPVEDETSVRAAAQEAIARFAATGTRRRRHTLGIMRIERFRDLDAFLVRVTAAAPERRASVADRRAEVEAAFLASAEREADGRYRLEQPLVVDVFT